ncbi:hypothetical protein BH18ACI1_BH18ACI1_18130 [soil metagenome]
MKSSTHLVENKTPADSALAGELLIQAIAIVDRSALGIAVGTVFGLSIFFATNFLIFKGGDVIGPTLSLLNQYFFGYSVTFIGSFIGLIYGFVLGFILGWLMAFLRNFVITIYLHIAKFKGRIAAVNDFIDHP